MIVRLLAGGCLAMLGAVVALVVRAPSEPWTPPPLELPPMELDEGQLTEALAAYLRIDTQQPVGPDSWQQVEIGTEDAPESRPAWVHYLVSNWVEPMGLPWRMLEGGLVITVPSSDPRAPAVWLSHADVVAVGEDERDRWTHEPFAGEVAGGFLWGRGALDNKASTIAQLEALRVLRAAGREPARTLHMIITPDEEIGGATAEAIAGDHLAGLGGPEVVFDEASFVLPDLFEGTLVGAVAVGEKTFVAYELVSRGQSGHASMPSGDSANDALVAALSRLHAWETPSAIPAAMIEGFARLAPTRPFPESIALGNADLLAPLLLSTVQRTRAGNAITRNTLALTLLRAGVKVNVVPAEARATFNARLLPGVSPADFRDEMVRIIDDDRVEVVAHGWPAVGTTSSSDTESFRALEAALGAVHPGIVVIPVISPATTDSRYFAAAGLQTYRIHPQVLDAGERARIHGIDERVAVDQLPMMVRFYTGLALAL